MRNINTPADSQRLDADVLKEMRGMLRRGKTFARAGAMARKMGCDSVQALGAMLRMKHLLLSVMLALCALTFSGCGHSPFAVHVPANTVKFETPYGKLSLSHPQNTDMTNVLITITTNGTVTASIGSLHTVNDSAVISAEAAGEVAKIKATGEEVREGFKAGIEAAANGAKKTVIP